MPSKTLRICHTVDYLACRTVTYHFSGASNISGTSGTAYFFNFVANWVEWSAAVTQQRIILLSGSLCFHSPGYHLYLDSVNAGAQTIGPCNLKIIKAA